MVTAKRKTAWRQIGRATILAAAILLTLPASAQTRLPPEDDGSTYTWPGATAVTVDVQPWGGGYVRSTPYLIDCPLACIRPVQRGREMTLTAYPTPGFTFERWTGACEGQPNPCSLSASTALVDITAIFSGFYVPPAPPAPPGPTLTVSVSGYCPGCTASASGTGFHPNSSITLSGVIITPPLGSFEVPNFATTDATGSWSGSGTIPCVDDEGSYDGPWVQDIVATDAEGAFASSGLTANCVEQE